jgi:hypothetical protein
MISWKPVIDGDDLLIGSYANPATASWFGGPRDSYDNGQTASGVDNTLMGVRGCSLPMASDANGGHVPACAGSPLGPIPWKTMVVVNSLIRDPLGGVVIGQQTTVPLIDVGPEYSLNRPLDLCPQTFEDLGGNLNIGLIHVFLRIVGGAKYLLPGPPPDVA